MPDTIDWLVRRRAEQHGDKPMVIDPEARIRYGELDETTRPWPRHSSKPVSIRGPRSDSSCQLRQWVQIAVALTRIGAVLVPLSTLLQPPELVAHCALPPSRSSSRLRSSAAIVISTSWQAS